jgi:hypothetical protein
VGKVKKIQGTQVVPYHKIERMIIEMKKENETLSMVGVDASMHNVVEHVFESILGSGDVQEILCINRSRLNALVGAGKLVPVKELRKECLFWKPQVLQLKKEMLKDTRTNLYKMKGEMKHA